MKKHERSIKKIGIFMVSILFILLIFQVVYALVEPGSEGDPIVTQSYIEQIVLPSIYDKIDAKLAGLSRDKGNVVEGGQQAEKFVVVEVKEGERLIGTAGCEMILRMGEASIIATEKGGLADTTQGIDLHNGANMPANHMLIVPMDDGRGFKALTDVLVMVKGDYIIKR